MLLFGHRDTTKEKIVNTAFSLLAARGYANVSLRDIASAAGISPGQIVYHYRTKENLITEVVGQVAQSAADEYDRLLSSERGREDPVSATAEYFTGLRTRDENVLRVLLDFSAQSLWVPAFREKTNTFILRLRRALSAAIGGIPGNTVTDDGTPPVNDILSDVILCAMYGSAIEALGMPDGASRPGSVPPGDAAVGVLRRLLC